MTPSLAAAEDFRKMARYIREHGFSPEYDEGPDLPECGCFLHAALVTVFGRIALGPLIAVLGSDGLLKYELVEAGWTYGMTDDAAAALDIVADLLTP